MPRSVKQRRENVSAVFAFSPKLKRHFGGNPPMPFAYVVQMDIPQAHEAEFNRVYDEEHVPIILKVPGVRSCQRYRLTESSSPDMPRYLAVYEVDSPEVIKGKAWEDAIDIGDWKPKVRPHTTNRKHSIFEKIA
jgi:hypothetical protein